MRSDISTVDTNPDTNTLTDRFALCQMLRNTYGHLEPFIIEGFKVKDVLLDVKGNFQVYVDASRYSSTGIAEFCISICPYEIAVRIGKISLLHLLTICFVRDLPSCIRLKCTEALDVWTEELDLRTRNELAVEMGVSVEVEDTDE